MTVFVTGGCGFIGSALVRRLVGDGETVVTVDKLTYGGSLANLSDTLDNPRHVFAQADIADAPAMARLFAAHRPDAVYHLAAETHVDRSIDAPAPFIATNVEGTVVLLDAALAYWRALDGAGRDRFRFLAVSTDEVFGELGAEGLFDERSAYRPRSPYAASKAAADHLVRAWHHTYGLPVLISNCGNNYGPYQLPEKLIPRMVVNALEGRALQVYGRGDQVRDWIHVDDHVTALRTIMERGRLGETYLVGARCERSNIDVVRALCKILDETTGSSPDRPHERLIEFVQDRPGHDRRYAIDPKKCETELDWRPRIPFEEGLARTVAWYKDNKEWRAGIPARVSRNRLGLGQPAT